LPRSRSHSGPTNPNNKSKQVAKLKCNSRSKGLHKIWKVPGGQLARGWWTVVSLADSPALYDGQSINSNRTFSSRPSKIGYSGQAPRIVRTARTVWPHLADNSANHAQLKTPNSTDQNDSCSRTEEHAMNTRRTQSARTVRGPQEDSLPAPNKTTRTRKTQVNPTYP
jgi:hypothetical protein